MTDEIQRQERIDDYVLNKMSDEERIAFEYEIRNDELLYQDVEFTRKVALAFMLKVEQKEEEMTGYPDFILAMIKNAEIAQRKADSFYKTALFWAIGTTVAALIVLVFIGFQPKYSGEVLFNTYYSPLAYEEIPSRSGSNLNMEQINLISAAMKEYKNEQYAAAYRTFGQVVSDTGLQDIPEDALFYYAISSLEENDSDTAIEVLGHIRENGELFRTDAEWYLALIYIENGKKDQAKELLEKLSAGDSPYSQKAKELSEKLSKKILF